MVGENSNGSHRRWRRARRLLTALLAGLLLAPACGPSEAPLQIGFVGGLTGRVAGLGVAGRDGVLLAVEEINRAGGVRGRPVVVITRDDRQEEQTAQQVVGELIDAGVTAIIGPMTSTMAAVMQPAAELSQTVMISPTVTASRFAEQDDWLLLASLPLTVNAGRLADYITRRGFGRMSLCLDMNNAVYSEDWLAAFSRAYRAAGGQLVAVERFSSGAEGGVLPMVERVLAARPDGVLFIAGAMDTALAAQQVRKLGSRIPLFATEWAFTSDVISFGGAAVEEMHAFVTYNPGSQAPRHLAFRKDFQQRFGYHPSFAAVLAYEATHYLCAGLARNPQHRGLKSALLDVATFPGLQGDIGINRYGDAVRQTYLAVIRDGRFVTTE